MSRWLVVVCLVVGACSSDLGETGPDAPGDDFDAPAAPGDGSGSSGPTAAQLKAKLADCQKIGGDYARDDGAAQIISICGLSNAVFWTADLDVDCDGKPSAQCSLATDPDYQNQTAATDSRDQPLDAAALPYIVVPSPSARWDFTASGVHLGSVVAVIHGDDLRFGVVGDTGPTSIIGEASYAMAASLPGVDPDPSTGGTDDEVSYIVFTGADAVVDPIENHDAAVTLGMAKSADLLAR